MPETEKHYGEVVDNLVDLSGVPLERGEVMVKCETLLSDERVLPEPVPPSFPLAGPTGGVFYTPEIGSTVELTVIAGTESVETPEIRYIAALYSEVNDIPDEFKVNYPRRWGIKTPGGQVMYFDFTPGVETIIIQSSPVQYIKIDAVGVTIEGGLINLGAITVDSVPYANRLGGFLTQFAAWAGGHIHPHPEGPTGGPQPGPPAIPPASAWSSPTVRLK